MKMNEKESLDQIKCYNKGIETKKKFAFKMQIIRMRELINVIEQYACNA